MALLLSFIRKESEVKVRAKQSMQSGESAPRSRFRSLHTQRSVCCGSVQLRSFAWKCLTAFCLINCTQIMRLLYLSLSARVEALSTSNIACRSQRPCQRPCSGQKSHVRTSLSNVGASVCIQSSFKSRCPILSITPVSHIRATVLEESNFQLIDGTIFPVSWPLNTCAYHLTG